MLAVAEAEAEAEAEGWAFRVDSRTAEGWLGCWFRGMSMSQFVCGLYGAGMAVWRARSRGE